MVRILGFSVWLSVSVGQAAQPGWASWCVDLFDRMASAAEPAQARTLDHPFLYRIEKDDTSALLFVTPPVPLPVWTLPSDLIELFLAADEWVGDEFSTREAERQLVNIREKKKSLPRDVSLSQVLSHESKMKLTGIVIENMKVGRGIFRKWRGYEAQSAWDQSALMSQDEKRIFMREYIEFLTPLEAYLEVVEFEKRRLKASSEKRTMGEQLIDLLRAEKKEIQIRPLTPPHQHWHYLERQLSQFTVSDLENYLRSMNLRSDLTEAYYKGDQDWAHREIKRRRTLGIKTFGDCPLLRMTSVSFMAKHHAQISKRRLYLINAQDAFGATGILPRLKHHGFKISRLEQCP